MGRHPYRAAVIGRPVKHSLSPLIHNFWAEREGITARYTICEPEDGPEGFKAAIDRLAGAGYRGANVTIPYKEYALKLADMKSDAARAIGAANMLTFSENRIIADNSDVTGFAQSVIVAAPALSGKRALVLGAGGAARAIIVALRDIVKVNHLYLTNRSAARAHDVAAQLHAPDFSIDVVDWSVREKFIPDADIIINTTSLGMDGQPDIELDLRAAKPATIVSDIVYTPLKTTLLRTAARHGLATIDGLEMLMRQAVPGYLAWLGKNADVDRDLRNCLETALRRRAEASP